MRIVGGRAIFLIAVILIFPFILAAQSYFFVSGLLIHPFFGPFLGLISGVISFYLMLGVFYRFLLHWQPFPEGELEPGSPEEERWKIYISFWLVFFYPLILPRWIPVPLTGILYRFLGAKVGANSYFGGTIYDPHLVEIGHHVLGGSQSLIVPHLTEGDRLAHYPIRIGNRVTIGAGAIILPGVTIEDDVIIGAGALIPKNSTLKRGDCWAGNPARFIKNKFSPREAIEKSIGE